MNNTYKFILLYTSFVFILSLILYGTGNLRDKNIDFQKQILIKQAQTHFKDQINNRKWNAQYGGVYVKPKDGLKANPYLKDNILKTEDGQTLLKVNPAWMTRQLSELSDLKEYHFRITSLNPINPTNKANKFETRALNHIENTLDTQYYEIPDKGDFQYMGGLITRESCMPCHKHQGYKLGDIRGGISISINTQEYQEVIAYIHEKVFYLRLLITFLLLSIAMLVHKQIKDNQNLQHQIDKRTKEILSTKILLQEVLDSDLSFLMVADDTKIILANKTMLNFFKSDSLEEFREVHQYLSNSFVEVEHDDFLSPYIEGEHWIKYLLREQTTKDLKVLMIKDDEKRYFKPHSKEVDVNNKKLHIIIFDDITNELRKIKKLKDKASKDSLTGLFNRGKFNDVLNKEIELSQTTISPLSIIFLDIDHFKIVNDTYGHDAGDYVLKEMSSILQNTVRKGDFVARWGGEEFVITLQATNVDEAYILAEKIRLKIQEHDFKEGGKQTISLGVTQYKYDEIKDKFMKRVDEALYDAKNTGRNKVVIH